MSNMSKQPIKLIYKLSRLPIEINYDDYDFEDEEVGQVQKEESVTEC